ncbi:hypothetical protein PN499_24280 [Kamptonema animale CS-326]|uniref:hypothetical protein n=1 Tax=Kamptonema animale TaxID=92934 RepID=UPI00232CA066|nr:hypothetical protein [Kamptonema animale]MDB9514322.1 hypothetical protein [Kamptonema animale CS-326]
MAGLGTGVNSKVRSRSLYLRERQHLDRRSVKLNHKCHTNLSWTISLYNHIIYYV